MRGGLPLSLLACAAALVVPGPATASPSIRFGIDDDPWLRDGPGSLVERLDILDRLGAEVVRITLRWEEPSWRQSDAIVRGLQARGIEPLVTLAGPHRWVFARPARAPTFGAFAGAAARRWPWVRRWSVWERPSPRLSATAYARRLLRPARASIRRASPGARVAAGEVEPTRATAWMRALGRSGVRMDAVAHRSAAGAQLAPVLREIRRSLGGLPIWLAVTGVETGRRGVSESLQAREIGATALRLYREPGVELLLHGPVRDGPRRQSGLFTDVGAAKMAAHAFSFPLAQSGRRGELALVWGQVRPREGRQRFRLQLIQGGETSWLGGVRTTSRRGYLTAAVDAPSGSLLRIWSVADRLFSAPLLLE
jgi:hypothetical protein